MLTGHYVMKQFLFLFIFIILLLLFLDGTGCERYFVMVDHLDEYY